MSQISFVVSTVGLQIPFVIMNEGQPLSNALSASVTWIGHDGRHRSLVLTSPVSSEFTYILSAHDFRSPIHTQGYLSVSFGTNIFYTSSFDVNVHGHF